MAASFRPYLSLVLPCLLAGACLAEEDLGSSSAELAQAGRWQIPPDVLAVGDTQSMDYVGAGPWLGEQSCSDGMTPGTSQFREYLYEYFPQISHIGGFSCRHINGNSSQTSVHATGRALDIHIPLAEGNSADNDLGDPLAHWLIQNSEYIGISLIIWDRSSWGAHREVGAKFREYGGAHPHHDHLHVELSVDASAEGTAWFGDAWTPPELGNCEPLPPEGGIIEEMAGCAQIMGPSTYWRYEQGKGHGESLFWTNAFQSDEHSNWARWQIDLEAAGSYEVEAYIEPEFSVYQQTRYQLTHGGNTTELEIDQSTADGWHSLGIFEFAAGGGQELTLFDNSPGEVAEDQHISADAIRLSASEPEPEPEPEPEEETEGVIGGCQTGGESGLSGLVLFGLALLTIRRRRARPALDA